MPINPYSGLAMEIRERDPEPEGELPVPLLEDLKRLGVVLDAVMTETEGPELLDDVERLHRASVELRNCRGAEAVAARQVVVNVVDGFSLDRAALVTRAFTVHFQLVNLAEERHRARAVRAREGGSSSTSESLRETIESVRQEAGEEPLRALLETLAIHPVLTAHPTEARRGAVVEALRRIATVLDRLDALAIATSERAEAERELYEQITVLWGTAQLRKSDLTPLDEVRAIARVFDETLFQLAPRLYRMLEQTLVAPDMVARRPPPFPAFLRWGTWVGGDRDGNPNVTAAVTEAAVGIHAEHVLRALEGATRRIGRMLTMSEESTAPSTGLVAALAEDQARFPTQAEEVLTRARGEPHRQRLLLMAERLRATRLGQKGAYGGPDQFLEDVRQTQQSLVRAGSARVAYGDLQHLAWQAETFGFTLASLEVREHSEVLQSVVQGLVKGPAPDALALDQLSRLGWPDGTEPQSQKAQEVLGTLRAMHRIQARWGVDACSHYVVSFSRSAADVVAARALARLAVPDASLELNVVPLFESRSDLARATEVLDSLLELPGWRKTLEHHGRQLEVMLGYSDSAKEVGFLAANLSIYRAQEALAAWARHRGIALTIFHGRGGALGRGGGPAGRAIRAQAAGSVASRFKVTEQGEVVFARYSNPAIALRHLEQVTSAVLTASTKHHIASAENQARSFVREAELMAESSEAVYRDLVESTGFSEFFAAVSPLAEIASLRIGSRPARRSGGLGLDQLRAIPWAFAWSQNRCNLPGWYGLGSGLEAVVLAFGEERLRQMNEEWSFFRSILENAEMSLAKADPMIAGLYLDQGRRPDLTQMIRDEFRRTRRQVQQATGHPRMLSGRPVLRRAVDLRNPYVDSLSFLQLRFLRELRQISQGSADSARLLDLVLQTVNGVAAGLQNTG
jgi:phosphoenolpyruvate carboxylase